jgi:mannose-6-phosphate isomerase-like protein (cupin superfamily)
LVLMRRYRFAGRSGYIVGPATAAHGLLAIGHSLAPRPWADPAPHLHTAAEELYCVLQGEIWLNMAGETVTVRPKEIVMVRPGVAHAVIGGLGPIEHFGLRAPTVPDKAPASAPPPAPPAPDEPRQLRRGWGCRVALHAPERRSRWVFGLGAACPAQHLALAYLTAAAPRAGAGWGGRRPPSAAWTYHVVTRGRLAAWTEDGLVEAEAGDIVEVPPGTAYLLECRQAPFEGFTLRAPAAAEDNANP